ncbi:MAG: hypothetical protein HQM02_04300 [Magnetococcales bacterium]|nr:hypothetical protein [Magnetococcales bacterium]
MRRQAAIATKGRVRVSRRISGEGNGVLVVGQERFQVAMVDVGLCGMCVLASKSLPHGLEVIMEVSESSGVDAYACRVAFCQECDLGWQIGLEIEQQDAQLLVIHIP